MSEVEDILLRRAAAAGEAGTSMRYGETSATMRLTERGLLRWEQTSPFVAWVWATEAGRIAWDEVA